MFRARTLPDSRGQELPVLRAACGLLMCSFASTSPVARTHAAKRMREVAIRTALGAASRALPRRSSVETGILAAAGALAGWAASTGLSRLLYVILPNFGIPLAFNLRTPECSPHIFITTVAMAVTIACGMYPCTPVSPRRCRRNAFPARGRGLHRGPLGQEARPADSLAGLQLVHGLRHRATSWLWTPDAERAQHFQARCWIQSARTCPLRLLIFHRSDHQRSSAGDRPF